MNAAVLDNRLKTQWIKRSMAWLIDRAGPLALPTGFSA